VERTVNRRSTSRPKGSAAIKLTKFLPECEVWPATGTRPGFPSPLDVSMTHRFPSRSHFAAGAAWGTTTGTRAALANGSSERMALSGALCPFQATF